ncbi:hypothetical protein D7B24_002890 [Verticillium nonalfalfae]|uniref:Zn(2)-C6 fungal-type domain-containing protein n=1 Tax=Verticillium nonalfalfae TaxID=1051616 RepID=A0A3M9XXN4_9PEZI|nr:uncharacterized protein D7B24_002890 [Verticillium nonalfalfae]RNJ52781.1 hypothetical protein D7B24_002890 [Verticillium nonalfalfae]
MVSQTDAESDQMTPRQMVTLGFGKQNHKSCDACRIRKVRCPAQARPSRISDLARPAFGGINPVISARRSLLGERMIVSEQFLSPKPTPKSKSSTPGIDINEANPAAISSLQPDFFSEDPVSNTPSSEANKQHQLPVLHVDSLLTRSSKASPSEAGDETPPFIRGNGIFAGDHSLTFFSETRLQSLASCLRNNKVNELRTFWCLYAIEKTSSFYFGRSSAFIDGDISCPIPHVPESVFGDFDWFLSIIRHARIISQTYSSLFSVAVANKPNAYYMDIIGQLNQKHDDWRMSIPDTGFRPGGLKPPSSIHCGVEREAAVMIHYYHDGLQLTLARATLHRLSRLSRADDPLIAAQQKATMEAVLSASRSVLERTVLVNVDSHTSICPLHVNTPSHLALLDMAGGHFSRIEYRSQGYLPGSLISEFAHIAREYVNDAHLKQEARATQAQTLPDIINVPQPQQGAAQVQAMANAPKVGPKESIPSDVGNVASAELPDFSMAFNGFPDYTPSNATMGTDVMGIFNYYLPELDPMFSQGLDEEYAFSQELSTGIPMDESMGTTRI